MITEEKYLKAKQIVQKYEKQLNISNVRKHMVIDLDNVIKSEPIMIKEGWGNLFV